MDFKIINRLAALSPCPPFSFSPFRFPFPVSRLNTAEGKKAESRKNKAERIKRKTENGKRRTKKLRLCEREILRQGDLATKRENKNT